MHSSSTGLTSVIILSARKRKYFLCRHVSRNKLCLKLFKEMAYIRPHQHKSANKDLVQAALSNQPNLQQGLALLSSALETKMDTSVSKTSVSLSYKYEVSKESKDSTNSLVAQFLQNDPQFPPKSTADGIGCKVALNLRTRLKRIENKVLEATVQQTVITQVVDLCKGKISIHKKWLQDQVC